MTFSYKLSRRLAQGFWVLGVATALAACAGDVTNPGSSSPVNSISITPPTADLTVSSTVHFSALLRDAAGAALTDRTVTWTSNAQAVASVSATGVVSGAGEGSATITATSEGRSASAVVTVTTGSGSSPRVGYYASPSGVSTGDGSMGNPWDLPTALAGAAGLVGPGDTLWLRGGTYRGSFRSLLKGTAAEPVVVRQFPGERAIIDGAGTTPSTWYVGGQYSVFWGFEITNSDPARVLSSTGRRSNVIANYASHTKYINLVVHDGGVGFYNESDYSDVEIVGCIIYNSGWQGPDRGHGHAIYLRSNTGPVTARDNIMFNQFGYGVHVFTNPGQGQLNNIHLEGNVSFNNGTLSTNSTSSNILFGGDDYSTGGVLTDNMTYHSPGVAGKNVQVGYSTVQNGTVQLGDNYFAGGATVLDVGYWTSVAASGNRFMGTGSLINLNDVALSLATFSGQTSALPTTTKVFVRPNRYEQGRANIVVYNWGRDGSVPVDLAGVLPVGARYEIRNVQDWFGAPVATGTYGGGSVDLPLTAVQPPTPTGMTSSRAPATGTAFNTYVVTIRS
jgi:hypothetical protein